MSLRLPRQLSEYTTAIFDDVQTGAIYRIEDHDGEVLVSIADVTGKSLYRAKNSSFNEVFDRCCEVKDFVCRTLWEVAK